MANVFCDNREILLINYLQKSKTITGEYYALLLDKVYGGHWIGNNGPVRWPVRSPDLNPLDYFYWGISKEAVYHNGGSNDPNDMIQRIQHHAQHLEPKKIHGGHFEQYLDGDDGGNGVDDVVEEEDENGDDVDVDGNDKNGEDDDDDMNNDVENDGSEDSEADDSMNEDDDDVGNDPD
ncbi:secreted acidic protein 1A-like [Phymastichus coffea]|uniref:secreted acidic protein 1A-like n=1 Tax=Phymastichus coffea TaxID=108790 RepID=UPI00273CADBB|nr:secreted acidic protein 1A-like [Phymastichus coffea]